MRQQWMVNDKIISQISDILERSASPFGIELLSIVLYGSRARGDCNSQSEYEIMVLISNNTELQNYIKFTNTILIELLKERLMQVKISTYTPDAFEDILYNDKVVGTFIYMICRDSNILYDKFGTFTAIKEGLSSGNVKEEENFLAQCVDFTRMLGSEKWAQKWEKTLMQFKYIKKRREF